MRMTRPCPSFIDHVTVRRDSKILRKTIGIGMHPGIAETVVLENHVKLGPDTNANNNAANVTAYLM